MWIFFKILNFVWLLTSTYAWFTTFVPMIPLILVINILMIICMGFLPAKVEFGKQTGLMMLALCGIVLWTIWCDGYMGGVFSSLCYMPVFYLMMLPKSYLQDLLDSNTKWYSVILFFGLLEYFLTLVGSLPTLGRFVYTGYEPYTNYGFYIKTTYDYGTFERFNGIFLEPGHQALLSTFLMLANSFRFRQKPYLFVLLLAVIFSFSLAAYLLLIFAVSLFLINNMLRAIIAVAAVAGFVTLSLTLNGGDNTMNELIVSRLEYDESKGIKGNNRFADYTEYAYEKSVKTGDMWYGIKDDINIELVAGAGFKIYVIKYGWIGVILAALFYLSIIPKGANIRYTLTFVAVLTLCFAQRSYPMWYSWLFPYVTGIYIHRKVSDEEDKPDMLPSQL